MDKEKSENRQSPFPKGDKDNVPNSVSDPDSLILDPDPAF
jgi:hypothetical protein